MGELLRGQVTAYPTGQKGLVEVGVGAFSKDGDKIFARVEPPVPGLYCLPEIGDVVEVEVPGAPGYEAQVIHVHRPDGHDQTSACWTEKNDTKQFKTRSGHTLTFCDADGDTSLTLCTAGGLELRLDDKQKRVTLKPEKSDTPSLTMETDGDRSSVTLQARKTLSLQCAGAKIEIDSSGNISISTKGKLSVSAQNIDLTAKGNLKAKGQQAEMSGSMKAKVSSQTKLELTASGITEVKGSVVKLN